MVRLTTSTLRVKAWLRLVAVTAALWRRFAHPPAHWGDQHRTRGQAGSAPRRSAGHSAFEPSMTLSAEPVSKLAQIVENLESHIGFVDL
jgi:hypothetical protein